MITEMIVTRERLLETTQVTKTDYWNDSCALKELEYAIARGAVGATTNPTIVLQVLRQEMALWDEKIRNVIAHNPDWGEEQVTWQLIEDMAVRGAGLLKPVYDRRPGKIGRLSIQTNPAFYRNTPAITEQAVHFNTLAPNMQVKIPVTTAGLRAIEEATFHGVSINATVCFTVSQAVAVAEAVERGLDRREAACEAVDDMSPVCTIMIGRTDDWMRAVVKRDGIVVDPGCLPWAGVAVFKQAYPLFQERGYRARLLAAAYRHHLHWSELIGGDIVLTIPYSWQVMFNSSDIEVKERIGNPVDPAIVDELLARIPDFGRAFYEDGMTPAEFDTYGATVVTLRGFISSYHELIGVIRDFMLPNPLVK